MKDKPFIKFEAFWDVRYRIWMLAASKYCNNEPIYTMVRCLTSEKYTSVDERYSAYRKLATALYSDKQCDKLFK